MYVCARVQAALVLCTGYMGAMYCRPQVLTSVIGPHLYLPESHSCSARSVCETLLCRLQRSMRAAALMICKGCMAVTERQVLAGAMGSCCGPVP